MLTKSQHLQGTNNDNQTKSELKSLKIQESTFLMIFTLPISTCKRRAKNAFIAAVVSELSGSYALDVHIVELVSLDHSLVVFVEELEANDCIFHAAVTFEE